MSDLEHGNRVKKLHPGVIAALVILTITVAAAGQSSDMKAKDSKESKGGREMDSIVSHTTIPFNTIKGKKTSLEDYQGKVVLVVNVASECGFTPQYADLERLYRLYKDKGLVIIGFPANNFGGQEPGTDEQIFQFCRTKFDVTFPMMSKISVKGDDMHPLFAYLTEQTPLKGEIKWNFEKFLLDKNGNLVARYPSATKPLDKDIVTRIEGLLRQK
jgi:glutathione peroxidase